jgi:hypothetical protein
MEANVQPAADLVSGWRSKRARQTKVTGCASMVAASRPRKRGAARATETVQLLPVVAVCLKKPTGKHEHNKPMCSEDLEFLRPLSGTKRMQVRQLYHIDHDTRQVIEVPPGEFASKIYANKLAIPDDAYILAQTLSLTELHKVVHDLPEMLNMIRGCAKVGSIGLRAGIWEVERKIDRIKCSCRLNASTGAGALLAASARVELAGCIYSTDAMKFAVKWKAASRMYHVWLKKPEEPQPILPPAHIPATLVPYVDANMRGRLHEHLIKARSQHGGPLTLQERYKLLGEINSQLTGPTLTHNATTVSFQYPKAKISMSLSCRTECDIFIIWAATKAAANGVPQELITTAFDEWKYTRIGFVEPCDQPRLAFPHRDVHQRENSDIEHFRAAADSQGAKILNCGESAFNDFVIVWPDGKAAGVQLKGSVGRTSAIEGRICLKFSGLNKDYPDDTMVFMATGQLVGDECTWACMISMQNLRMHNLNVPNLCLQIWNCSDTKLQLLDPNILRNTETGVLLHPGPAHVEAIRRIRTTAKFHDADSIVRLCEMGPKTAIYNDVERQNRLAFLKWSGFELADDQPVNYTKADFSIIVDSTVKRIQLKAAVESHKHESWAISFKPTYRPDDFDWLVVVIRQEGYWRFTVDELINHSIMFRDGRDSNSTFSAHRGDNHWTSAFWNASSDEC